MCWHKWSKWQEYEVKVVVLPKEAYVTGSRPIEGTQPWQRRQCEKCGYVQRKEVNAY